MSSITSAAHHALQGEDENHLRDEIRMLESRLAAAKAKLDVMCNHATDSFSINLPPSLSHHESAPQNTLFPKEYQLDQYTSNQPPANVNLEHPPYTSSSASPSEHALLLLSDSALPLGSFAFSSGLESYLAHHRSQIPVSNPSSLCPYPVPQFIPKLAHFERFLDLSLRSLTSATLPYLLSSYRDPTRISILDNNLDASTPCTVARRASIAQGRALLGVWDRAFKRDMVNHLSDVDVCQPTNTNDNYNAPSKNQQRQSSQTPPHSIQTAKETRKLVLILETFHKQVKRGGTAPTPSSSSSATHEPEPDTNLFPNGHFPPIFGAVSLAMGLSASQAAYVYLFGHVRAVVSAAVRAGVMGPYQAQTMLASRTIQNDLQARLSEAWDCHVDNTGQVVPVMDLWVGRHELLYSRIFNS